MGNSQSQSTDGSCPNNPMCRAICFGSKPPAKDDGEWFGDLPRDGKKRKKKRNSSRSVNKMPVVPEAEAEESVSGDTVETHDDNNKDSLSPLAYDVDDAASDVKSALAQPSSPPKNDPEPKATKKSHSTFVKGNNDKVKVNRKPKKKLTFVNGQFVDLTTLEGQEMVNASLSLSEEESGPIKGILTSVKTGHSGLLGPTPPSQSSSKAKSKPDQSFAKSMPMFGKSTTSSFGSGSSLPRAKSDVSNGSGSVSSVESEHSRKTSEGLPSFADMRDAVSSIVVLGNKGHLLTASKCDRDIKMWKVENVDGKTDVRFIRDFVGHSVGISCLAKVDHKGRFLSASKERRIKLWDSRYNCEDDDNGKSRTLLATFDKMDRRQINDMAIIEEGTYVRPTDNIDMAMAAALTKKAMKSGSMSAQQAAQQRQILACSCKFATISGRHPVVKVWSVKHIEFEDGEEPPQGKNIAQVKLVTELKHDAVVESVTSIPGKKKLLTGDRMGNVMLWQCVKNVFSPGSSPVWSSVRTFSWKPKNQLSSVGDSLEFAITSLSFLEGNELFVSGSKSGNLRVWKLAGTKETGEIVKKEEICITGAHNSAITAVKQGPLLIGTVKSLSFSSASEDGKVLSFAVPAAKVGSCNPCCFNAVNHQIANRYMVDTDAVDYRYIACLTIMPGNGEDVLITGSSNATLNILKSPSPPKQGQQNDALVLYRQAMEEESLTLYAIGEKISKDEAVESRTRKLQMKSIKNCFLGSDAVSFLVDNQYAASRKDAVALGCVLTTHLSLFECVSKKGKLLEDDSKSFYRWASDFSNSTKTRSTTSSTTSSKKGKMKKWQTTPDLERETI